MRRSLGVLALTGAFLLAATSPAFGDQKLADTVTRSNSYINTNAYTPTIYTIYPGTNPCVQPVIPTNPGSTVIKSQGLAAQWAAVPLPCYFQPSAGSDGESVVIDKVHARTYEFWQARWENNAWHATWGGADDDANFHWSYGVRAWDRAAPKGGFGVQASGLAFTPGTITISDLRSGVIRHPVDLEVPQACKTFRPPAISSDGINTTDPAGCFQYGTIYKLPASVDITGLPFITRAIAQAAKDYGLVVSDQTHASVGFRAENYVTPWGWWAWDMNQSGDVISPYRDARFASKGYDFFGCKQADVTLEWSCYPDRNNLLRAFPWAQLFEAN